jgi:hypothetical protein
MGRTTSIPHTTCVREERLIASVYDSLRSVETVWQQTLLIVTYDKHGGSTITWRLPAP